MEKDTVRIDFVQGFRQKSSIAEKNGYPAQWKYTKRVLARHIRFPVAL